MDGSIPFSKLRTGLLIDSERIYTEVTNAFLASHGKDPLPAEIKAKLMGYKSHSILIPGRPGPSAAKVLLDWAELNYTPEELYAKTTDLQVHPVSLTTYKGKYVDKS
jgi:pseudouridine 5'-phosphatase